MVSSKIKFLILALVLLIAGLALADSLGFFNPKPYTAVTHGPMIHYVPRNRDPDVPIERFPTREPGPGEMITPEGQMVKKPANE